MSALNATVALVRPRFPENIGMIARACANMGCAELRLVNPERWDILKAEPLATSQGMAVLKNMKIFTSLAEAIADCSSAWATSARTGRHRGRPIPPDRAAGAIAALSGKAALVFGPEDRGLSNEELALCQHLIRIPTASAASSLNLAQAVLLTLYECRQAAIGKPAHATARKTISQAEWQLLARSLKQILAELDCPAGRNPDYYFRQWAAILRQGELGRQEFDTLMGFCRQIKNRFPERQAAGCSAREAGNRKQAD